MPHFTDARGPLSACLALAAIGLLAAPAQAAAACSRADGAAEAVACEIDAERRSRGLPALRSDADLGQAGRRHARDMVRRGYFSHAGPGGESLADRVRDSGYLRAGAGWAVGEVLAWGTGDGASPAAIVAAWMDSPPHRRVLLSRRYRDIGVGVVSGTPDGRSHGATYAAELGDSSR